MYLLDTNTCIAIFKSTPRAANQFRDKIGQCYISTIVLAELYKGSYCSQKIEKNLDNINDFLRLVEVVELDRLAALEFGKIQAELRKKGRPTGDLDALIGSVARSRGDILVTHNVRHFINISGLQLEDWIG